MISEQQLEDNKMHYYTVIEELYQTFFELAGEKWVDERDNETHADQEIKRLIEATARQLIRVYQERLAERAQEQQEECESLNHSDTEQYGEDGCN